MYNKIKAIYSKYSPCDTRKYRLISHKDMLEIICINITMIISTRINTSTYMWFNEQSNKSAFKLFCFFMLFSQTIYIRKQHLINILILSVSIH